MLWQINTDEHVSVTGMTGSGKTHLLRSLVVARARQALAWTDYNIVVLDTKMRHEWDSIVGGLFGQAQSLAEFDPLLRKGVRNIVYSPYKQKDWKASINDLLVWAFEGGPILVVIDELASVARGNKTPPGYDDLMQRGRAGDQTIWAGIQKPIYVPADFYGQSDHLFCFYLGRRRDRMRMAEEMESDLVEDTIPDDHGFWYKSRNMREPVYFRSLQHAGGVAA